MAGGIGDDEFAFGSREVAVGDVDRDSLLSFGAKTVSELGEVDGGVAGDGSDVVVVDIVRVVEQAADEGGFAVVDTSGGGEAEQSLCQFRFEALFDGQFCIGKCGNCRIKSQRLPAGFNRRKYDHDSFRRQQF